MPIGVIINALSVAAGGVIGALFGHKLPEKFNSELTKIFGGTLGMVIAAVAIPQCVIFLIIFAAAKFIFPLTTPDMIADFKACGGFLLLATGFRIAKIHDFPVADMIPAMVLVMPVSWFWVNMIVPVL